MLAERALTPLIATANAQPDQRQMEDRGLMVHSAAAVRDADGRLLGVLEGGVLLNKNLAFIDRLNDIVYPAGALPVGSAGTATLFLGDVRVATNVRLFEGGRAIRTQSLPRCTRRCWMKEEPGWTVPLWSMTGMSRRMNRCSIAMSNGSGCSMSVSSMDRSRRRDSKPLPSSSGCLRWRWALPPFLP